MHFQATRCLFLLTYLHMADTSVKLQYQNGCLCGNIHQVEIQNGDFQQLKEGNQWAFMKEWRLYEMTRLSESQVHTWEQIFNDEQKLDATQPGHAIHVIISFGSQMPNSGE
jgi:hypothetical protein